MTLEQYAKEHAYSARTEQPVRDSGKAVRYKREV